MRIFVRKQTVNSESVLGAICLAVFVLQGRQVKANRVHFMRKAIIGTA